MNPMRKPGTLGVVLALALSTLGCASAPQKGPSGPPTGEGPPSLIGEGPWTVTFVDDACSLSGVGSLASVGKCDRLGELKLDGPQASSMGRDVAALTVRKEETAGGAVATLSTGPAVYQLDPSQWGMLLNELKSTLITARVTEREARYARAPSCPEGQVVLDFNDCPGNGTVADVCGRPTVTCGAPVATGGSCLHNGACASRKCTFMTSVCEE